MRLAILILLTLWGAVGCSERSSPDVVWRFALEETRGSVQDRYAQAFKRRVEQSSAGRIRVEVYPYGTLGTSDQITELLYNGSLQIAMASPGHLGKLMPEVQVLLLHFLFSADEEVNRRVLSSAAVIEPMNRLYAEKGFHLLGMFSEGWQVWTTNRKVLQPRDFVGLKFRVMTSPLLLAAYEAYGASATPLPYSDVYSGLQLRMIDGQVNPIFAIEEMSFHEVTSVLTFAKQAPFISSAVCNAEFYRGLSAQERGWLDRAVQETDREIFEVQRELNKKRLEAILKDRPEMVVVRLNHDQRESFRLASQPVRELYVEQAGPRGAELLKILSDEVQRQEERSQ